MRHLYNNKGLTQKNCRDNVALESADRRVPVVARQLASGGMSSSVRRHVADLSRGKSSGLTLLEVLVATGLVVVGLVGTLTLLAQATKDLRGADNRLIAAQLSQEAIEVVIAIRDSNWVAGREWTSGIPITQTGTVDYNSTSVATGGSTCLSRVGGIYVHAASPCNTTFSRHLEITNQGTYLEVATVVGWTEAGGRTPSIRVVDHLYDWR